jgi:voltage-gated potassium channel
MMLLGWGILAVPTGIVTAEMAAHRRMEQTHSQVTTRTCHECLTEGHTPDAEYCFHCGARLPAYQQQEKTPESA